MSHLAALTIEEDDRGVQVEAIYRSQETGKGAVLCSCPYSGYAWLDLVELEDDPELSDGEMGVRHPFGDLHWSMTEH